MQTVSKSRILVAAIFTPVKPDGSEWGLPILIESSPGTGKTSIVRQVAKVTGLPFKDLSPALHGEAAFGVVPLPTKSGKLVAGVPAWTDLLANGGILFVDELTSAPPALQGPCLGLAAGKTVGDHKLPGRVRVVSACNPPDVAANGHDLAPPLANRFGHLAWPAPKPEEHKEYMMGLATAREEDKLDAVAEEARVMAAWPAAYARAVALETSFLMSEPSWQNKPPAVGDEQAGKAWPSSRTWEYTTCAYASATVHGLTEAERRDFVAAFIGVKAMTAWFKYIDAQELPNVQDVLDGKATFEHDPKRIDRTAAFLSEATAIIAPEGSTNREARSRRLWAWLLDQYKSKKCGDLVTNTTQDLVRARSFRGIKEAGELLDLVQPIISATASVGKGR